MTTTFSQFNNGGAIQGGDIIVGLRGGINTQFNAASLPSQPWLTLLVGGNLAPNTGYFLASPGPATFTLPAVAPIGSVIDIVNVTGQIMTIAQNAGQQIHVGAATSTLGAGGGITSIAAGQSITLVCQVENSTFFALTAPQGIWNTF